MRFQRLITLAGAAGLALQLPACASAPADVNPPPAPASPVAPWNGGALERGTVAPVYFSEWSAADNRASCGILAPASLTDAERGASVRRAQFGGGWGVAYDLPGERSAFGIAGTGVRARESGTYRDWPHQIHYTDGSWAGYGLEGGTGTKWLAYIEIASQGCLYNVWSQLGRSHLESLISRLRLVRSS